MKASTAPIFILGLAALFLSVPAGALADTTITVKGTAQPASKQTIATKSIQRDASETARTFLDVLANDLRNSGWFVPTNTEEGSVTLGGTVRGTATGVEYNVTASWMLGARTRAWSAQAPMLEVRDAAHALADAIVEDIAGKKPMASSKIVLVGRRAGLPDIYRCDADGARLTNLTMEGSLCVSPNWIPGKNAFLYTSWRKGTPSVYEVNLDTNRRRVLSARNGMNQGTVVSPDGKRAAILLSVSGGVELYLIDPASGRVLDRLTRSKKVNEASPSWSPDGNSLVYASDEGGVPRCYVMNLATRQSTRLTYAAGIGENVAPEWGPDGRIAFCGKKEGRYRIFVADPSKDSRISQPIDVSPKDGANYEDPSWAPDGRHIVCTRTVNFARTLVVLDTDPNPDPCRTLFSVSGEWYLPSWSSNF